MTQETLMANCPATGCTRPYPSHAAQWRKYNGATAWLFNPWSGRRRSAEDVGSDPFGMGIRVETKPVFAAAMGQIASQQRQEGMAIFGGDAPGAMLGGLMQEQRSNRAGPAAHA